MFIIIIQRQSSLHNSCCFCIQIHSHEVSFSDQSLSDLKLSHSEKLYPPRFTLQVSGLKASGDAILRVDFEGAQEDLSMEIVLTLPTEGTP